MKDIRKVATESLEHPRNGSTLSQKRRCDSVHETNNLGSEVLGMTEILELM